MAKQEKVQILMSTYNGEQYLSEQIESLLRQTYPDFEILIRDDGSTDGTRDLLKKYEKEYRNIQIFLEENKGVTGSFFRLLELSDASYVAFCDQDDVWLEEKIERAVNALKTVKGEALYCGNKMLVDAELKEIGISDTKRMRPGFGNALVENIATGCTIVMNQKLTEKIKQQIPKHAVLHDWWCYLMAAYYGEVIYDEKPYIYYRQHGDNQVGGSSGFVEETDSKIKYLRKSRGRLKAQLTEFYHCNHGKEERDKLLLQVLETQHFGGKIKMIFNSRIYRQKKLDNFVVRGLFLINAML